MEQLKRNAIHGPTVGVYNYVMMMVLWLNEKSILTAINCNISRDREALLGSNIL